MGGERGGQAFGVASTPCYAAQRVLARQQRLCQCWPLQGTQSQCSTAGRAGPGVVGVLGVFLCTTVLSNVAHVSVLLRGGWEWSRGGGHGWPRLASPALCSPLLARPSTRFPAFHCALCHAMERKIELNVRAGPRDMSERISGLRVKTTHPRIAALKASGCRDIESAVEVILRLARCRSPQLPCSIGLQRPLLRPRSFAH